MLKSDLEKSIKDLRKEYEQLRIAYAEGKVKILKLEKEVAHVHTEVEVGQHKLGKIKESIKAIMATQYPKYILFTDDMDYPIPPLRGKKAPKEVNFLRYLYGCT